MPTTAKMGKPITAPIGLSTFRLSPQKCEIQHLTEL